MKNKKKLTFKIFAGIVAVALSVCIPFVTNAFVGNPISQRMATKAIKQYVDLNYSSLDLEIEKTSYDFKFGEYVAMAKSKTSIDTKFAIHYHGGKVQSDDYESHVLSMFNTSIRIPDEYSAIARNLVAKELGYDKNTTMVNFNKDESGKLYDALKLDMKFNKSLFISPEVVIRLDLGENSMDVIAKILTDAHKVFVENDCNFVKYGLYIQNSDMYYVDVNNVTPADIESGKLTNLLKKAKTNRSGSGMSVLIKEKKK